MFPIHNCRPARMQPGRGVRALSLLSVGLLSLLPPQSVYPLSLSSLLLRLPLPLPPLPSAPSRIFHFNISIFMPHLRKFKVTVRRHNFLPPPRRQRRTLPGGQERRSWWRLFSPPLRCHQWPAEGRGVRYRVRYKDRQLELKCNRY